MNGIGDDRKICRSDSPKQKDANDGEDIAKVRCKIIIGRDGSVEQVRALRRHNGHLHRIEILTFDHLLRIARNVPPYLETVFKKKHPAESLTVGGSSQN